MASLSRCDGNVLSVLITVLYDFCLRQPYTFIKKKMLNEVSLALGDRTERFGVHFQTAEMNSGWGGWGMGRYK